MNDQCLGCGEEIDEWSLTDGLCKDCDLERQGYLDPEDEVVPEGQK